MIHKFKGVLIYNGDLTDEIPDALYSARPAVYEIIRVIDRIPLFLSEHIRRLEASCRGAGIKTDISANDITDIIERVISSNSFECCNIKVVFKQKNEGADLVAGYVESHYPERSVFTHGASVRLHSIERSNPNIKMENRTYVTSLNEMLSKYDINEVLIVNNDGYITEGGRSNVFFVKGGKVYIPKKSESLKGITQMQTLSILRSEGIEVNEEKISIDDMKKMDALFLTGTSIDILPVSKVDDIHFDSVTNPVIIRTASLYDSLKRSNISARKKQLDKMQA